MTVRDNPVKRIMVVRKIGGKLVIDIQGTVGVPIKLKLISVPVPKTRTIFPDSLCRNRLFPLVIPIEAD